MRFPIPRPARRAARWIKRRLGPEWSIQAADAARDRSDWPAAIYHYRRFINRRQQRPGWALVQLGHALKERGDLEDALRCYEEAVEADEGDRDALRHLAFLQKSMHRYDEAHRSFGRLRTLDRDPALNRIVEWMALGARRLDNRPMRDEARAVRDLVQESARGLRIIGTSGLARSGDGTLLALDDDPWLEFTLDAGDEIDLALLHIDMNLTAGDIEIHGRLYFDYGAGFSEANALVVTEERFRMPVVAPRLVRRLRWDPDFRPLEFELCALRLTPMSRDEASAFLLEDFPTDEDPIVAAVVDRLYASDLRDANDVAALQRWFDRRSDGPLAYARWRRRYVDPSPADYASMAAMTAEMAARPSISIVMPVYDPPLELLAEAIDSILAQNYPNFELCIADDRSPNPVIRDVLIQYADLDPRVKLILREENGHISAASNSALELATGEFVALVDHDDLLPDYALFVVAYYINRFPSASVFFSDEDKVDERGMFHSPYMKGAFNRYLMYGHNMVSHLGVYRRSLLSEIGGFRTGFEGSQDYDLVLRALDRAGEDKIVHIPHVLYHWRTIPGSTSVSHDQKSYAIIAAQRAIGEHFVRNDMTALSIDGFAPGVSAIGFPTGGDALVSIVILTRDRIDLLAPCIDSILTVGDRAIEMIIVDNGSIEPATIDYLADLEQRGMASIVQAPGPFNFSALNNAGAAVAKGEFLCFLNNDTEIVSEDIFSRARGFLGQADVGVVGTRLLYPDGHLQHFGLGLGMAEHRVALALHAGLGGNDPGYFGKARLTQEFGAVTAACLFVRAADFARLAGFDESLPVASNDVDLCLRLRAAGLRVGCDGGTTLIHKESRTRGSDMVGPARERLDRDAAAMRERWGEVLDADPFISPNHSLADPHFSLAAPPRQPLPWRIGPRDADR